MSRIVVINLGSGNLRSGFPNVTALLWEPENPRPFKFTGALPPATELNAIYRRWQLIYQALYRTPGWHPRIKIEREDVTNVSQVELADICTQYLQLINEWLDAEEFRSIDRRLRSHLHPGEEIQLIIETDDESLRRLPWHFWNFLSDFPKAEIALSAPQYQRVEKSHSRDCIRILAILGNSNGIDITADREILAAIPDAETVFLVEPSREELDDRLWDERGWDILFFAGHSEHQEEGDRGLLAINPADKIGISHLKSALKTAIGRGLQLAIFNSCEGLGLARELADLHIPQIIVMREPIADRVANAFLVHFVKAFSRGSSFYLAVRQARERLQGLEDKFPCASWLPIICQNPAEVPMRWQKPPHKVTRHADGLRDRWFWIPSLIVAFLVILIRQLGLLQGWELSAYDRFMRSHPPEPPDPRIVIVEITESDVQDLEEYPISDAKLTQLLQKLAPHQPRAIGLTLYRDFPVPPGHSELISQLQQQSNVFAVCSFEKPDREVVRSLPVIPDNRLGFDDFLIDPDNVVRRHLLFMKQQESDCNTGMALSFKLAEKYLAAENIFPHRPKDTDTPVKLENTLFHQMKRNSGGYKTLGKGGWYMMLNYRSSPVAETLTLTEVLNGQFNPNAIEDRIALIGVTASSTSPKSFVTPHTVAQSPSAEIPGLMLQAQMVSQILSAVLDGRPLIGVWFWWGETIWIALWSAVGGVIFWGIRGPLRTVGAIATAIAVLYALCFLLFLQGTWVPLIPPALALVISYGLLVTGNWSLVNDK
ncbi:CHASE2 domain-containing protein [Phormidium sp. CCY1219]|uniref:CHASE2 domain-containing protein n=1 Tax=Phormidium sp. CCY1219 TaxID=2886104 RepID=UPI002D1EEF58|nr:CHASE2 domain-containing protein [Phormidium sp. CCY1219]MEB3828085.1 CHASE2 domain-containing protein [Phormidium sp. CCY1219]